jgi:hypothetical protein
MALEDAAVIGELFGRSGNPRDPEEKCRLLAIYITFTMDRSSKNVTEQCERWKRVRRLPGATLVCRLNFSATR